MRLTLTLLAALVFGAAWTTARAQETPVGAGEKERPSLMGSNAEGFRFIVGFMMNETWQREDESIWPGNLSISIASRYDARVTVILPDLPEDGELPPLAGERFEFFVKANTVVDTFIHPYYECFDETVSPKGIEIISDRPITVSCYNSKTQTSDGYLALPVGSWGTEYIASCYYVDHYDRDPTKYNWFFPRRGEFAVIASEDNTLVTVYPTTKTLANRPAGVPYVRTLMKGDIFQVQDGGNVRRTTSDAGSDLSGSYVVADKPVGFLSGHMRTSVPNEWNTKDHLVEMLPPVNALGKRYMAVPFDGRMGGDIVRVINTSTVPIDVAVTPLNSAPTTLRVGGRDFTDYELFEPAVITANVPILVTQYARSASADPRNATGQSVHFDPDMVVLTPEEQFVNGAIFATLPNRNRTGGYQFINHFVTIIGERDGFDEIELNGKPIGTIAGARRGDLPGGSYVYATIEIPQHSTQTLSGTALFSGYLYGLGEFDSYAWPVGSGLRRFDIPDAAPPMITTRPVCGGYEVVALDSGALESGLKRVWLDDAISRNAVLTGKPLTHGIEMWIGHVRAVDARTSAFARVVAEDRDGNRTFLDITIDPAAVMLSSDSISFGNVNPKENYSRPLTISNGGRETILIDSIYLVRGFDFMLEKRHDNVALAGDGGNLALRVWFRTDYENTRRDTLVCVIDCREYRIPLVAYGAAPQIATHALDFGRIRLGRDRTMDLLVVNTGLSTLRIDSATIEGATFSKASELRWPVTIEPGEDTVALSVTFRPSATARFDGAVRFYSNVPDSVAVAPLTGVGIYPTLSILGHNFGKVQIGDTLCTTIPVANIGSDTAFLTGLTLPVPEGFIPDQSQFPHALPHGDTMWVRVCFAPREERDYLSDVSPRNDDDLMAMNTLRGRGYILRATLGGADLGRRWIGDSKDSVVYVTNVGTDPITITRVWLEGGDAGDFRVEPLDAERTLAPGDRMPVGVNFTPIAAGHREAYIHAETASRQQPQLDSVLIGFGLFALSSDTLIFDDELAYSCGDRTGRIVIDNLGNTPLTIASIAYESVPPVMTINAPDPGYTIAVGESLVLDFELAFAGYTGATRGSVRWSFAEPPNIPMQREFSREFTVATAPQSYAVSTAAPSQVVPGETFELAVAVDRADWADVLENEVSVLVEFDPTMVRFDEAAWASTSMSQLGPWVRGTATQPAPGQVEVRFRTSLGQPMPVLGVTFPGIPFQAFLGERQRDTLRATMTAVGNLCALPVSAASPVSLDSICGLSVRLFEFTGSPFVLRPNRPNPVTGDTEILFTLAMESPTRLELFAPDGSLVAVLVDATLAAGDYTIPFDARDLPSGRYLYRLTSGTFSANQQMQVAR